MGKTLRATHAAGEPSPSSAALDERDEADFVVGEMMSRRSASSALRLRRRRGAVSHERAEPRAGRSAAQAHAMPYRLVGAVRFYDRREIRDLMCVSQADRQSGRRRGVSSRRRRPEARARRNDDRAARRGVARSAACRCSRARASTMSRHAASRRAYRARRVRATDRVVFASARPKPRSTSCCSELVDAIRYGDYLRAEGPESAERLDNVRELITGAAETVADELGEVGLRPLDHFLQRATLVAGRGRVSARRRRRHAHDDAQRQGPRVSRGVHHRARGRTLSARQGVRRSAAARGRATSVLRRHHARRAKAVHHASPKSVGATARCMASRQSSFLDDHSRRRWSRSAARSKFGAPGAR